ncbi:hypothetical protein FQR65_LT09128 [Abscondita terminalis]|nr:hypothetical protein FQR65_LT09128 [Abscondita terminalis]
MSKAWASGFVTCMYPSPTRTGSGERSQHHTASPEIFSGDEGDDEVIASSPEPAVREEEPTAGPAPPPQTSSPSSSGKNFSLLQALYDVPVYHVPETDKHLPTPPPTTPPVAANAQALESDDDEEADKIFVGLDIIQDHYEEGLSSIYNHLNTGSAFFVYEITVLDKRRKEMVKKLEKYYDMMLRIKNKLNTLQHV